jgi:hypothetical protein
MAPEPIKIPFTAKFRSVGKNKFIPPSLRYGATKPDLSGLSA